MEYRIDKQGLMNRISAWDGFLKRKVHLIACGGTAMTLLGIKTSTKDIDLLVPNEDEHKYLIDILQQLGYKSASGWGWQGMMVSSLIYSEATLFIQLNY